MNTFIKTSLLILPLCLTAPAAAQQSFAPARPALGKVEHTYVKLADGVFMEVGMAGVKNPAETWSDVRLFAKNNYGLQNRHAKNPQTLKIGLGDVVEVKMGEHPDFATGPIPLVNRVAERVAPAGSGLALRIERENTEANPARRLGLLAE